MNLIRDANAIVQCPELKFVTLNNQVNDNVVEEVADCQLHLHSNLIRRHVQQISCIYSWFHPMRIGVKL